MLADEEEGDLSFRFAREEDVHMLTAFALKAHVETYLYHPLINTNAIISYIKENMNTTNILKELKLENSKFLLCFNRSSVLVGYAKVNMDSTDFSEFFKEHSMEIQRFYVDSSFHRRGIGMQMLHQIGLLAKMRNLRTIWLTVWNENTTAIKFYKTFDFIQVHAVHKDIGTALIMSLDL